VLAYGESRRQIAVSLKSAYSDGLLSQDTFAQRLDQLFSARLIYPIRFLGDLSARRPLGWLARHVPGLTLATRQIRTRLGRRATDASPLLELDWAGGKRELFVGRHFGCDVVLSNRTVSRHHACLVYRDGVWVLHDLQSTNGTTVNGVPVSHCVLRPGDDLVLGDERLKID
jgi:hypothetical protein